MKRCLAFGAIVFVIGLVGTLVLAGMDVERALVAWVAAFEFGTAIALGALLLVMIMVLSHARWFVVLRPLALAVASTLVLFAVLFVPIALGMKFIFPWAHHVVPADEFLRHALEHQKKWMNLPFFLVRAVVFLGAWASFAILLSRSDGPRRRTLSAVGIPVVAFTMTWAAVDWFMSLNPGWSSDMYGVYYFAAGFSAACALLALLAWLARRAAILPPEVGPDHFHALGRLMLLGTILWAYIGYAVLILTWIANLPREVTFYVARIAGPWTAVSWLLVLGHFVAPFLLLLVRDLKRRPDVLAAIAVWMLLMHAVDAAWLVLPVLGPRVTVLDFAPFLVVAGSAFAFGAWRYFARETLPTRDPAFADSLRYHSP